MKSISLNPGTRRNLSKIIAISVIWFLSSLIFVFIEKGVLGDLEVYPSTGNRFSFGEMIITGPFFSMVVGALLGAVEVFWLNKQFRSTTFGKKIVLKTLFYLVSIVFFTFLGAAVSNSVTQDKFVFSKEVLQAVGNFFSSFAYFSIIFYVGFILFGTLFFLEISDNLGQGVLRNFLIGKYHSPKEEQRIFMFLDLKSSTAIAERLGHIKYFNFLNEYYQDITEPIVSSYGIIYQYVGDEVVVSWDVVKGLEDSHCIQCFYDIKSAVAALEGKYLSMYGIVPAFKAGMHFGGVTVGEIGSIKKEIVYSGDVLNTTARIQSLCNSYQAELLVSEDLVGALGGQEVQEKFHYLPMGDVELRGRDEKIGLCKVLRL